MAARKTKTTTAEPTTELTAAQQDRIARTVTPICRKCGKELEPDRIAQATEARSASAGLSG